ncbi:MAG: cellulase family glycosylhydrolase [Bacteroidales bacterium]|nr:cellulase family glycosylhydrolase [Bacteroidales bacterium]
MKSKFLLFAVICFFSFSFVNAQVPFSRGVNITNWFQTSSARQIQFTKYTKQDFINIKSLGCDVVRLPINLHYMTNGAPNYVLDTIFLQFLDSAVFWAGEQEIYLILDNHTFDPNEDTDPNIGIILNKVWLQMADHYKNSSGYILYEVLNEPHGITTAAWSDIQQDVIDVIRSVDTEHTIIVGPSSYNSYNELANLPVYDDDNLIYTFHFYDPFLFTHQGASWTGVSMEPVNGIPFPYNAGTMPACPASLVGTWVGDLYNNYPNDGLVSKVKSWIDIAVNFKNTHNVDIFCGEFGVYIPNSDNAERVNWYGVVREYFEEKGIPWTIWDYKGGFGIFEKNTNELFDYDLNVPLLQQLGFTVPDQQEFVMKPDSVGFLIYTDAIAQNINEASSSTGTIDFYSAAKPNNEKYCLYWTEGAQYNQIGFDFSPNKDLSRLVNENYALDFIVRGDAPGTSFDVRFLDSKTDEPDDHPWRMRYTIDETEAGWDGYWHHLFIPLSSFTEQGAWDGTWYNPIGAFDWSAIDRFQIVAEHESLEGKKFWFDNIHITNMDTATIHETSFYTSIHPVIEDYSILLEVYPNPMQNFTTLSYNLREKSNISICIYSVTGEKIIELMNGTQQAGNHSILWNGTNSIGIPVPAGIYFCTVKFSGFQITKKILVTGT